jgi:phytoene dehydrogenase-like protein
VQITLRSFTTSPRKKLTYHDSTVYVFISKKYQQNHAPEGKENWFTLINVPHDAGQNWDELIADTRKNIINKLNKSLGVSIEPLIISETIQLT